MHSCHLSSTISLAFVAHAVDEGDARNDSLSLTCRPCIIVLSTIWTPRCRFMLVDLPELGSMKPTLYELMRPVMEEWDGGVPLVPSAIYGIRIYTEGSILQVPRCLQRLTDGTTLVGRVFQCDAPSQPTVSSVMYGTRIYTEGSILQVPK